MAVDLNPKAVTNDELFGIINPSTREWKDGRLKNSFTANEMSAQRLVSVCQYRRLLKNICYNIILVFKPAMY